MKSFSNETSLASSSTFQQSYNCFKKLYQLFPKNNTPKFSNGIGQLLFNNDISGKCIQSNQNKSKQYFKKTGKTVQINYDKYLNQNGNLHFFRQYQNIEKQLKKQLRISFKSPMQMEEIKKKLEEIELKKTVLSYFTNIKQEKQKSQFSFSNKGTCFICSGHILMNQSIINLGCCHHFHSVCIEDQNVNGSISCPICSKQTSASENSISEQRYSSKEKQILEQFQGIWEDSLLDYQQQQNQNAIQEAKSKILSGQTNLLSNLKMRINSNVKCIESILSQIKMVKRNRRH